MKELQNLGNEYIKMYYPFPWTIINCQFYLMFVALDDTNLLASKICNVKYWIFNVLFFITQQNERDGLFWTPHAWIKPNERTLDKYL
jgi:hypothetical protein